MEVIEPPLLTLPVSSSGTIFKQVRKTPFEYQIRRLPTTREIAIAHVVRRFGLSRALAAAVAELAGLGGRHS